MDDFFSSKAFQRKRPWQRRRVARWFDTLFDRRIAGAMRVVARQAAATPPRQVLVVSIAMPGRSAGLDALIADLARSRHAITACVAPMGDRGKFENINLALADHDLDRFDWLIVIDDDVALPPGFLDNFLLLAERLDLKIAQPAHRCLSYASFTFNHRRWNTLARVTRYVEDGPVTAFHRDILPHVLPFPALRWAWGTDIAFCAEAAARQMRVGIVDAVPVEHLRPVAGGYRAETALAEARAFLAERGLAPTRGFLFTDVATWRRLPGPARPSRQPSPRMPRTPLTPGPPPG